MVQFDDSYADKLLSDAHGPEEERYVQNMAAQLGFDYVNLQGYSINPAALAAIPEHQAMKAQLVGFELKQKKLMIAAKAPNDSATKKLVEELVKQRYEVSTFMCSTASLEHAWKRYKDVQESSVERKGVMEIDPEKIEQMMSEIKEKSDIGKFLKTIQGANSARRISETMQLVFAGALALGASDIHIEPEAGGIRLRYRFDGVLHDIVDLQSFMHERMMSRFKLLSGMKLNRSAEAQDGRFTFDLGSKEVEIRSSVIPGALGESIVMRVLDPTVANFSLENIELSDKLREVVMHELKKPNGLILTTGPTGSGKTTILYSFLRTTLREGVKIITIENPVEYKVEGIVQTQTDADYTFASGLRALLRQDPDIIMVGEIRDQEVAETAIHAAQTGHLVFSTLHTNSAVASFSRLIDLGVDPHMLGTSINLILGQRLVRLLCKECKKKRSATPTETAQIAQVLSTHPEHTEVPSSFTIYEAVGCDKCGDTGYRGRAGIFEGVLMDVAVEEAILRDPREHSLWEAAKPQGIPTMTQDGIDKVLAGMTSLAELERVVELPAVVEAPSVNEKLVKEETEKEKANPEEDDFFTHVI